MSSFSVHEGGKHVKVHFKTYFAGNPIITAHHTYLFYTD